MNHRKDYDRDFDREEVLTEQSIKQILEDSLQMEEELMRRYIITAERIHQNGELVERLLNFAQGNAKRSRQLQDEIKSYH
jgi:hypothetical protein